VTQKTPQPTDNTPALRHWQWANYLVLPEQNRVCAGSTEFCLEPRLMTALQALFQAPQHSLTDAELMHSIWPDVVVSDASLYQVVAQLRKVFGDQQKPYQLIERVQRKGYRLCQPATAIEPQLRLTDNAHRAEDAFCHLPLSTANVPSEPNEPSTPSTPIEQASRSPWHWQNGWRFFLVLVLLLASSLLVLRWLDRLTRTTVPITTSTGESSPPALANSNQQKLPHNPPHNPPQSAQLSWSASLTAPAQFSSAQWSQWQQAVYLLQQPRSEDIRQAQQLLEHLLPTQQQFSPVLVALCDSYHALHHYDDWSLTRVLAQCAPLLQQALRQTADFAPALSSFGALRLSAGDLESADYYLQKANQLHPNDADTLLRLSLLARQQGNLAQAVQYSAQALALRPLSGLLARQHAYHLIANGQLTQARAQFQQALLLDHNYSDRPLDELELLPLTGARALAAFDWAVRFPDRLAQQPERQIHLALVYLSLGQIAKSEQLLQQLPLAAQQSAFGLLARAMLAQAQNTNPSHADSTAAALLEQRAALQPNHLLFQLQALLLNPANLHSQQTRARSLQQFYQWLPAYQSNATAALQQDLATHQQLHALFYLLCLPDEQRRTYQTQVLAHVQAQPSPDSFSLKLLLATGLSQQAAQLAEQLLAADWLPAVHDDFYLAEQNPLYQQLPATVLQQIQQRRQDIRQQARLRSETAAISGISN